VGPSVVAPSLDEGASSAMPESTRASLAHALAVIAADPGGAIRSDAALARRRLGAGRREGAHRAGEDDASEPMIWIPRLFKDMTGDLSGFVV